MRRSRTMAAAAVLSMSMGLAAPVLAQEGPQRLTLSPDQDSATAGTCNEFTVRVTGFAEAGDGPPVQGVTVDVVQSLQSAGTEPGETRELSFCDPVNPVGPNPTGGGVAQFGDVGGNNPASDAGQPGRNTVVHGEVGPTDANGQVTFGIAVTPLTASATVGVRAWYESDNDDDYSEGDPSEFSTKTWDPPEEPAVTSLDAAPEAATNENGTQHQVTVTVADDGTPVQGVVPESRIVANGTGRAPGDVANGNAGASPNFVPGAGNPSPYGCTASDNAGVSTCTFTDPAGTGPGTDTIVFFEDAGGTVGEPDGGEAQDAVRKTWVVTQGSPPGQSGPPEARNIQLCHGDSTGTVCAVEPRTKAAGDEHLVSARVTNRSGDPLSGVPVQLRESGPGFFTASGGGSVMVTTDPAGIARAEVTSDLDGTSSLVAEISPPGVAASFRGPGASDDECEQPAGPGGVPRAGNCTSATLTVTWISEDLPECDDGLDNDADGYVDEDDPACTGPEDDSEAPPDEPPDETTPQGRRVSMRFRDWVGPVDEGLVIFGRLRLTNEVDRLHACVVRQTVLIQRRVEGEWVTKKTTTTNRTGRYTGVVLDFTGPYRAVAPRSEIIDEDLLFVCRVARREKTHHHRR